jgi:hypothetical protein
LRIEGWEAMPKERVMGFWSTLLGTNDETVEEVNHTEIKDWEWFDRVPVGHKVTVRDSEGNTGTGTGTTYGGASANARAALERAQDDE